MSQPPKINLPQFSKGANPLKFVLLGLIALILLFAIFSCIYTVPTDSQAVVLRFGKYLKTVEPGLRFKLPLGIDRQYPVATRRQLKMEFGFGTADATNQSQFSARGEQELEKTMVTGDLNAALVEWVVQYNVNEPRLYLFNVRNPEDTLRDASESVMRVVVGDRTVDEVITIGRQEIESEALTQLQTMVDIYKLGIGVDQVQLKDVDPPKPVQASFNEVNEAQQEKETTINNANREYNAVVPKASGQAAQKISEAEGYALQRVNEAEGDAGRFEALLTEYLKAPEVTRQRLYLETMAEVLPQLGNKIILDDAAGGVLPLLNLDGASAPLLPNR